MTTSRYVLLLGVFSVLSWNSLLPAQTLAPGNKGPGYPLAAKAAGIEGQVILHAIISKQGKVEKLVVVSGPKELRQAALDVVTNWRYKPYLLDGVPSEVDTKIIVNFNLGNAEEKVAAIAKAQAELAAQTSTPVPNASSAAPSAPETSPSTPKQ